MPWLGSQAKVTGCAGRFFNFLWHFGRRVMKLFYLADSIIPSLAANSVHVMKMCAAFARLGHSVTLFARKNPELEEEPHYFYGVEPTFQLIYRKLFPPKKAKIGRMLSKWRLRMQVNSGAPDLIYARDIKPLLAVASLGIPFVFEQHFLPQKKIQRHERLFGNPNFERFVVVSQALKDDYLARFSSLDNSKALVAHDGADAPLGAARQVQLPGEFKLGYLGHLYPGKGMEIISKLPTLCPWAHFHIVGGREEDVMSWRSQLASILNITLHGFVPHRETIAYLHAFDVVLAPYQTWVEARSGVDISRWMSPLKLFEYMSVGKPIIASDLPVLREVLEHGRNALLVPPDDVNAWVDAVNKVHSDGKLRQRLGQEALRDFNTNYSWDSRAKLVLEGLDISG